MTLYDSSGERIDPRDVLDDWELDEYRRSRSHRAATGKRARVFPDVDRDGVDTEHYEWGSREYGGGAA